MNTRCDKCRGGRLSRDGTCPACLVAKGVDGLERRLEQFRQELGGTESGGIERRKTAVATQTRAAGAVARAVAGLVFCPVCRAEDLWEDRECCPVGAAVGAWEAASVMEAVAGA